jgi:carboxyl-terminal processing protease
MKRKVLSVLVLVVLSLIVGLAEGVTLDRTMQAHAAPITPAATSTPAVSGPDLELIKQAWDTLQQHYVDRPALDSKQLTYGAISGMVDSLGDTGHSRFLTPQMVHQEDNFNQGQFEGIGAEVDSKDGNLTIVAPIDGSPAQKAGLKPGDIIAKVDGKDISQLPLAQAVTLILGPAGTKVTLTILDPTTGAARDVTLVRANIALHSVTWQRLPGTSIGHLRLAAFTPGVTKDLEKALTDMKGQGITGVILDLRSDPGGLLGEAIGAASEFLPGGNVLQEKDAQGRITPDPVRPGGAATTIPVVVLTDQGTASAAEIVAAALQDAGRAKIVGQTTFGTGTVLQRFDLADGSAELIATKEWLSRDGRELWRHGVSPDVVVALPADVQPLIPEAEGNLTATGLQNSKDAQLLKAITILQAPSAHEATVQPAPRS